MKKFVYLSVLLVLVFVLSGCLLNNKPEEVDPNKEIAKSVYDLNQLQPLAKIYNDLVITQKEKITKTINVSAKPFDTLIGDATPAIFYSNYKSQTGQTSDKISIPEDFDPNNINWDNLLEWYNGDNNYWVGFLMEPVNDVYPDNDDLDVAGYKIELHIYPKVQMNVNLYERVERYMVREDAWYVVDYYDNNEVYYTDGDKVISKDGKIREVETVVEFAKDINEEGYPLFTVNGEVPDVLSNLSLYSYDYEPSKEGTGTYWIHTTSEFDPSYLKGNYSKNSERFYSEKDNIGTELIKIITKLPKDGSDKDKYYKQTKTVQRNKQETNYQELKELAIEKLVDNKGKEKGDGIGYVNEYIRDEKDGSDYQKLVFILWEDSENMSSNNYNYMETVEVEEISTDTWNGTRTSFDKETNIEVTWKITITKSNDAPWYILSYSNKTEVQKSANDEKVLFTFDGTNVNVENVEINGGVFTGIYNSGAFEGTYTKDGKEYTVTVEKTLVTLDGSEYTF
ncbi:hypothetical protein [Marinitoga sp. 38H-ov]|uniref:hypothetical protein n=1 Tax=Marinitoga sp. 38H-ov TaxID=1755814 RepID=UPI0013EB0D2C|nr:hypothetical protein [Marinitoga sp. 38H-ov]KAF2955562.1 hypothetical protein AS160_09580 [Marinitoga sp. 38H-ov]